MCKLLLGGFDVIQLSDNDKMNDHKKERAVI